MEGWLSGHCESPWPDFESGRTTKVTASVSSTPPEYVSVVKNVNCRKGDFSVADRACVKEEGEVVADVVEVGREGVGSCEADG